MSIVIDGLTKQFDGNSVIDGLSATFQGEKISVLLGASGCGKTTTLRCIAGLEVPNAGRITIEGEDMFWFEQGINVPPEKRDVAMVFQSYAIWPHMTVFENVCLPLKAHGFGRREAKERVEKALTLVGLEGLAGRSATQLSGGQQQRVALARSIVRASRVILLDEPLSNLDAKLRITMRRELKELHQRLKTTMIFVTHDQEEAMSLGDEVFLFRDGRIIQNGPQSELYMKPRNRFVAEFLGKANFIPVSIESVSGTNWHLKTQCGITFTIPASRESKPGHHRVCIIRPEAWKLENESSKGIPGHIIHVMFLGDRTELLVDTPLGQQCVVVLGHESIYSGQSVFLQVEPECIHLIPEDSH